MNTNQTNRTKIFYTLMCLAGFLLILFPVGIANFVFGYMFGDSPCVLCWGQREAMIFIGVIALFIVRYGLKGRYLSALLIITAAGLYQSFAHYGNHAHRDLDQGFSLAIFGIHTYFWAEVIFWAVILLLGVIFAFAPKFGAFDAEMQGQKFRKYTKFSLAATIISAIIVASNVFQAFVSTGIPPYVGQGDPVRFTLNPKFITWSTESWKGLWQNISFLGKRDVKAPDYAFAPAGQKLGITFDNDSKNAPFKKIDTQLQITGEQTLPYDKPINTLAFIGDGYVLSSKWDVAFLDKNFKIKDDFKLDPYYSATIEPIIGIIPYKDDKFILMGSNKTYLRFKKNPQADETLQYAQFITGADKFEGIGEDLGRGRLDTIRSKFHHVGSIATDNKYLYLATVPNNKNQKSFVISKFSLADRMLSGEFTPRAELKEGENLGNLYITSMAYKDGYLYALSKNHNIIVVIDPAKEEVVRTMAFPNSIRNARSLFFKDGQMFILSYEDNANKIYALK